SLQVFFGLLIAGLVVGGPLAYAYYRYHQIRNFHTVKEGVLYRSGQMSLPGLKRVIHDYGIKTVVTLRDALVEGDPPPDLAEEQYCRGQELFYYRIRPRTWWASDGSVPAEKGLQQFRQIISDPKHYPILIHCFAGIHRTGAYCAVYRMEVEHWPNARAIEEMKSLGYDNLEDDFDV